MGKQQDREKIVQEIKIAADLYRKHLVGKRFLYVFEGRYIEVLYKAADLYRKLPFCKIPEELKKLRLYKIYML